MSTFTEFVGPSGGMSAATTQQLLALIEQYNTLSRTVNAHISEKATDTGSTVHAVKSLVDSIKSTLDTTITTLSGKVTSLETAKPTIESNIATNKAAISDEETRATEAEKANREAIGAEVTRATKAENNNKELIDNLTNAFNTFKAYADNILKLLSNEDNKKVVAEIFGATSYLLGKLHAHEYIDFTKWVKFNAQFGGTGTNTSAGTNGVYVLGMLSEEWDADAPNAPNQIKTARAYIKYVNTKPFDAIVDMTVTSAKSGALVATASFGDSVWANMKFHLLHGTDSKGATHVYLAMSADGLTKQGLEVRAAGVNFIPGNTVQGFTNELASVPVSEGFCATTLFVENLSSDSIVDSTGKPIIQIEYATDALGQSTKHVYIGDESIDELVFNLRPAVYKVIDKGESKEIIKTSVVTFDDLQSVTGVPVGVICEWPLFTTEVDEDPDSTTYGFDISHFATSVPENWLACDGSKVKVSDYPDLAEALGFVGAYEFTLPVKDFAIIKAKADDIDDMSTHGVSTQTIMTLDQMTTAIKAVQSNVETEVRIRETKDIEHDTAIETLEGVDTNLQTGVGTLQTDVGTLQTDVGTLQTDVGTLQTDVGTLQTDVGTLQTDVGNLQNTIDSFSVTIDGTTFTDVASAITEVVNKMSSKADKDISVTVDGTAYTDLTAAVTAIAALNP